MTNLFLTEVFLDTNSTVQTATCPASGDRSSDADAIWPCSSCTLSPWLFVLGNIYVRHTCRVWHALSSSSRQTTQHGGEFEFFVVPSFAGLACSRFLLPCCSRLKGEAAHLLCASGLEKHFKRGTNHSNIFVVGGARPRPRSCPWQGWPATGQAQAARECGQQHCSSWRWTGHQARSSQGPGARSSGRQSTSCYQRHDCARHARCGAAPCIEGNGAARPRAHHAAAGASGGLHSGGSSGY